MKHSYTFVILFVLTSFLMSCNSESSNTANENETDAESYPKFKFDKIEHDFGRIEPGSIVKETFHFENIGDAPLIITNARASCGCTLPEYPKEKPIEPGEKGEITVEFNSNGKMGQQNKAVTVYSNVKGGKTELRIFASVEYDNQDVPTPSNHSKEGKE